MSDYIIKSNAFIFVLFFFTACGSGSDPTPAGQTGDIPINATKLHWSTPILYENGVTATPSDIGGYNIYKGDSASTLKVVANVPDSNQTQFDLITLGQGTFYFAVSAYDNNNIESKLGKVLYLTVP